MNENTTLMCRIFGHKWQEESQRDMHRTCADGQFRKFTIATRHERKACGRCGSINPNYEDAPEEKLNAVINKAISDATGFPEKTA